MLHTLHNKHGQKIAARNGIEHIHKNCYQTIVFCVTIRFAHIYVDSLTYWCLQIAAICLFILNSQYFSMLWSFTVSPPLVSVECCWDFSSFFLYFSAFKLSPLFALLLLCSPSFSCYRFRMFYVFHFTSVVLFRHKVSLLHSQLIRLYYLHFIDSACQPAQ